MRKAELIERLANKLQTSKSQAGRTLDVTLEVMTEVLLEGSDIQLRGFGVFQHKVLKGREGRLPGGERVVVPERRTVRFSPSKHILENLVKG